MEHGFCAGSPLTALAEDASDLSGSPESSCSGSGSVSASSEPSGSTSLTDSSTDLTAGSSDSGSSSGSTVSGAETSDSMDYSASRQSGDTGASDSADTTTPQDTPAITETSLSENTSDNSDLPAAESSDQPAGSESDQQPLADTTTGEGSDDNPVSQPTDDNPPESQATGDPEVAPQSDPLSDTEPAEPVSSDDGASGPDLTALETEEAPLDDPDDPVNDDTGFTPSYFEVQQVLMSPLLNPGTIIELVSGDYVEGDMVVAQLADGTHVVKVLEGDQLVPLGAGVSYSTSEATILGKAELSALTTADLEAGGFGWSSVLATTATLREGSGDPDDPYKIATWDNLYLISDSSVMWDKHYLQTADISLPDEINIWNDGKGWNPIGTEDDPFTGSYNGNGFTISNLFINRSEDYIGLFGYTSAGAELSNINLVDVDITGDIYVGGLVGWHDANGTINNSYVTGIVTGTGNYIGGLVGNNGLLVDTQGTDGIITNSYATGDVHGEKVVAGLVGIKWDSSAISGCFAAGNVTGPSDGEYPPAALVGVNIGTITNCFASGLVNGNKLPLVGLGSIDDNFGTLTNVDVIDMEELWNVGTYQESSSTGWVWLISTTDIMVARGTLNPYPYPVLFWEDDGFSSSYTWFIYLEGDEGDGGSDNFGSGPEGIGWYFDIPTELVWPDEGIPEWARTLIFRGTSGPPSIFSPNFIVRGTSADLLKAVKAYIQASLSFEQNKDSMTEAEYAVAVIELAVAKAAIMIVEARLSGDPAALAAAIEAYEFAQTLLAAHGSYLSGEKAAAISSLIDAIASVISTLSI